ncbi:hypothetical protein [Leisingera sp. F5]|uniref:hypothetical protein n=1 Tax=Leisingera sp. F5 TaxID=1813816 RepID=UPI000A65D0C8|nr:hypothetical protein [Leisingera sp. F5]
MRSADKSELHQDITHSLKASHANSVQQLGTDILTPLASRSLFWRARYLETSPVLCHIPLLFWLTEAARPRIAVTLGVADAVPHFALCQAVDKLGLDSLCFGVEPVSVSDETVNFNKRNYVDFSDFVKASGETPNFLPHSSKADLIVINKPASKALIDALRNAWLPQLSARGVILFLHAPEADAAEAFHAAFAAEDEDFTLWQHGSASIVLHGSNHSERLLRLVQLQPGHSGFMAASTIFRHLGELHSKTAELEHTASELIQARQSAALSTAELQKTQAKLKTRADQDETLPKLHRDLTEARQENDLLHEELKSLRHRLPALEKETIDLRKLLLEQEETLSERYTDIATLGLEIQAITKETDTLRAEREATQKEIALLKEQLSAATHQRDQFAERVQALEHSTSWKVTAPLRQASQKLKRA